MKTDNDNSEADHFLVNTNIGALCGLLPRSNPLSSLQATPNDDRTVFLATTDAYAAAVVRVPGHLSSECLVPAAAFPSGQKSFQRSKEVTREGDSWVCGRDKTPGDGQKHSPASHIHKLLPDDLPYRIHLRIDAAKLLKLAASISAGAPCVDLFVDPERDSNSVVAVGTSGVGVIMQMTNRNRKEAERYYQELRNSYIRAKTNDSARTAE